MIAAIELTHTSTPSDSVAAIISEFITVVLSKTGAEDEEVLATSLAFTTSEFSRSLSCIVKTNYDNLANIVNMLDGGDISIFMWGLDVNGVGHLLEVNKYPLNEYRLDEGSKGVTITIGSDVTGVYTSGGNYTLNKIAGRKKIVSGTSVFYEYVVNPILHRKLGVSKLITEGSIVGVLRTKTIHKKPEGNTLIIRIEVI